MIIVLSPMAGINDKTFRSLCLSMGADVVYTEMISVNGLVNGNKKSFEMLPLPKENAVIQLFGNDPEYFSRAVDIIMKYNARWVDLNAGCPVPKVVKNGYGAALMKNPLLVRKLVEMMTSKGIHVSVKMRVGWKKEQNFMDVARAASDGGAFLVSIHGRTVEQGYSGNADWEPARILKKNLKIKIGVSGDIFTPDDAINAMNYTNADMLFIARGAIGNPWIFRQIKEKISGDIPKVVTFRERRDVLKQHLMSTIKEHGVHGIMFFRKFLAAYLKGLPESHAVKARTLRTSDLRLLMGIVNAYFDKLISCEQGGVERGNTQS